MPTMSTEQYELLPADRAADDLERELLDRWESEDLFRQTLEKNANGKPWVFFEGPPTANGRPGIHHVFARTIKDLICRYHVMLGQRVTRIGIVAQAICQGARIDRGLRRAVRAARIHRMRGVAGQRHTAESPLGNGVFIDHWVFENLVGIADHLRHVEPIEVPAFVRREKVGQVSRLVPVVLFGSFAFDLGHPIDQLGALTVDIVDDRVDHNLAGEN